MITKSPLLRIWAMLLGAMLALSPMVANAQDAASETAATETTDQGSAMPGLETAISSVLAAAGGTAGGASPGVGQSSILLFLGLTVLSLAPAIAITVTCFPFMVTVLSILRQSLGLQQSPPNMLIVSLALFLTWFVMDPVLKEAWAQAGPPLQTGQIGVVEALSRAIVPFERFMAARTDPAILDEMRSLVPPDPAGDGLRLLIPSFMLTELQRAFEIGFLIALPFLVIDLVVSAVLMAMGMMMVPPAIVALPFKLAFFVVVDGWALLSAALVRGYQ